MIRFTIIKGKNGFFTESVSTFATSSTGAHGQAVYPDQNLIALWLETK